MLSRWFTCSAAALLAVSIAQAQEKPKKWEMMDYGRFFSATFNNTLGKPTFVKQGCAANKAIVIKLGTDGNAAMLFDTDLLRMAGGWTGGFFKAKGVAFDGGHGPNPQPPEKAEMYFETNPTGPGWSKGADLNDPRTLPTGPGAATIPFGPLPHDWAKYKGLYLHGDQVVLAYTVGATPVLELPGLETAGDQTFLTRSLNVLGKGEGSTLVLADLPEGSEPALENGAVVVHKGDAAMVIGAAGLPAGAKLEVMQASRVVLTIPAFTAGDAFKIAFWKGAAADAAGAEASVSKLAKTESLTALTKGGPAHWTQDVTVKGELANETEQGPYVVDHIGLPVENPYKSWIRVGALDFFSDGRLAFTTWSGDVWIGKGIDARLENITWHRYATGLFQPLGLKIVDDQVYVLGRDQITRLHDLNNDGEADFYECFNNDVQVTPGFHEFTFELQTDPQGNFYFAKGGPVNPGGRGWGPLSAHNGCLFKVSKDGEKFEVYATGLRAPNGIGVSPTGEVTTGDNQGTWVPVDYIHYVKQGDFIEVPDLAHRDPVPDQLPTHLCWIPYDTDNSNGSQLWVTSDKWGPLKGRMLYLSYGKSSLFNVLEETAGDVRQGGVVRFPLKFQTGIMRARFNPVDGQLYAGGLRGWQTNGSKDGAIERVRYTGAPVTMQTSLRVTNRGIHIGFSNPIEAASAGNAENYSIEQYNYHWTKDYGSAEYKPSAPDQKGRDPVEIKSVRLSDDRKEIFLEVPGLKPVMQMRIKMNLKADDGSAVADEIGNTINVVPEEK